MQTQPTLLDATTAIFDDFVRDALGILLPAFAVIVWIWTGTVALFDAPHTAHAYLSFTWLFLTALGCYHLSARHLHKAVLLFLAGLLAVITTVTFAYHNSSSLFLYLQVIVVAAALTSQRRFAIVSLLVVLIMLVVAWWADIPRSALWLPLFVLIITAVTAWLSARRLFTALDWSLKSTEQARLSTEEARAHRSELQRTLQSLDIALSRLERSNRALAFAQEAADKAYRFKSDFVANVSHELRTPLNLIVGFSEMMTTAPESYGGVPLPKEYRGDMLATYRSARHLLDLINDVLDLSQIETGRMAIRKERVTVGEVIGEAIEIVRGLAEARKLHLDMRLPQETVTLNIDHIRIRQVLLNLLTNAMRYTPTGWVRVEAKVSEQEVTITVSDSGQGIAQENLHRAFEAFDRLDEDQLREGSGLGLAISKKFVELHDGRMWIESEVGHGTQVHFTLPLPTVNGRMALSTLHIAHHLRYDQSRPRVLVLHDDSRVLDLLRRHVGDCDFTLTSSLDEAQSALYRALPDVMIVDTLWAESWQARLQDIPAGEHLPILTCSLPSTRHFGLLIGATDFLPKPVSREDLARVLMRLPTPPTSALVIDDDPHVVRLIARILKSIAPDLRVMEAFGGEEGLTVARSQPPDVIFVDLGMPGMSGRTMIQAVRGDPALLETPIIVVSVRSVEEEALPLGGEVRLQQLTGFSLGELLAILHALLATLTRPEAISPTSAAARLAVVTG